MMPAENFGAFKDLQDLTAATDAEIKQMLIFGCSQGVAVNFEDVLTEHLLRLFRHITGVEWIRGWEQGARPDKQYGTVWFYGAEMMYQPRIEYATVIDGATGLPFDDLCEVVYQDFMFQFQLDSYRDSGLANRNQEITAATSPQYSAVDVITRLMTALGHPRFRSALLEKCIALAPKPFGKVRNLAKPIVQNTFESRANVDFFVCATLVSSMRSPTFGSIDWGFICPTDAELYPDPPPVVIC